MRRAFVTLSNTQRQVHYRFTGGGGGPLVLLPATPDSSAALDLTDSGRNLIALDLPGYGESDPLPVSGPSLADYADALAETLDGLGLEAADLEGWGSGASIAGAFAERYPERVGSVRTHDPVEPSAEMYEWPSLAPEWDGTHLVRAWMIRRDMHLFRPWFARVPAARLRTDMPPPAQLHREFVDLLRAGERWGDAERAALRNGTSPAEPKQPGITATVFTRDYADMSFGQVHLRRAGPRGGVPLLMLHASPGSSRGVLPLAALLATRHDTIAMDTPGFGDSDPLLSDDPSVGDFADAVLDVVDGLGAPAVDLYGTHTGASIALETAVRGGNRIRKVVFDGMPMFSDAERADHLANYIPPFEVHWDGSHVVWAWNFIRNMTVFYPWYHMDAEHSTVRVPDTLLLHERVVDVMKAGPNYARGYRAVYRYDPRPALAQLSAPAMVCASREDVLAHHAERLRHSRPDLEVTWLPSADRLSATAATIDAFLG